MIFSIRNSFFLLILIIGCNCSRVFGYEIYGNIVNHDSLWDNKIYLSFVEPDNPYWSISPDQIINTATIDAAGSFSLKGINLPEEKVICRLYVNKPGIKTSFQLHPRNHVLLILDNDATIEVNARSFFAPDHYTVSGSYENENKHIRALHLMRFGEIENREILDETTLQYDAWEAEMNNKTRGFIRNCSYPLVAIIATHDIIDFESDYIKNRFFYDELSLTRIMH